MRTCTILVVSLGAASIAAPIADNFEDVSVLGQNQVHTKRIQNENDVVADGVGAIFKSPLFWASAAGTAGISWFLGRNKPAEPPKEPPTQPPSDPSAQTTQPASAAATPPTPPPQQQQPPPPQNMPPSTLLSQLQAMQANNMPPGGGMPPGSGGSSGNLADLRPAATFEDLNSGQAIPKPQAPVAPPYMDFDTFNMQGQGRK